MKLIVLLLTVACVQVSAAGYAQQVTLKKKNASLEKVFEAIYQQTGYQFVYSYDLMKKAKRVSIDVKDASLKKVLKECFASQPFTYTLQGNAIIVKKKTATVVKTIPPIKVTGTVTDSLGNPLIGVTIKAKSGGTGAVTDYNGNYSITVPDDAVLVVSYVGYQTKEVGVKGRNEIDLVLSASVTGLNQLIVVGYGTQKKSDLTGSITSISTEQFKEQPVRRISDVLQGRAAGVQVMSATGAPGGSVRIRIRGANSILGDNNPLYVVDGFVGANISTIDPNNIASIQVLKDASATAIYGSRGANGVIIVTTKQGKPGAISISYNGKVSTSQVIKKYDLLGAAKFAEVVNTRDQVLGLTPTFTQNEINDFKTKGGTDWQDEIFRRAIGQQHELSISGGTNRTTYFVSGNYLNQEGILKNTNYTRTGLRSNLSTDITDKLSFNLHLSLNKQKNKNTQLQTGTANPIVQAVAWAPTTPVYQANGQYTAHDPVGSVFFNPVALLFSRENIVKKNYQNVTASANYEFLDGLNLKVTYAVNHLSQVGQNFADNDVSNNIPTASQVSFKSTTHQETNTLTYDHEFNGGHHLTATGVFEVQKHTSNTFNANATDLLIPALKYDNLALSGSQSINSGISNWSLVSFLARVNYSYKDRYMITATVRRDGSSKFSEGNRYSTFPAIGVAWNLTNEKFLQDVEVISHLKLRASWGKTGSQAIAPFATQSAYNTTIYAFNSNSLTSGLLLGDPGNPNLKWETTDQKDIGLEIGLFNGRVDVNADYYIKSTNNLLINRSLPSYVGGGVYTTNAGKMRNQGWDFAIGAQIIDHPGLTWSSHFNISFLKNRVKSLGGIANKIFTGSSVGAGYSSQSEFVIAPGHSLGAFWGLKYLGTWKPSQATEAAKFDANPGDSRYEDLDGDHDITSDDYQIIGYGMPTTTLGWNNTLTYQQFTLNFFFSGSLGFDKLNYTLASMMSGGGDARQFTVKNILNRYIPKENEQSDIPAFSKTNVVHQMSSRFLGNGSYIRLKNVSLSYDIPLNIAQREANLRLFFAGTNLLTFTDYKGLDPESSNEGNNTDVNQGIDYGAYPHSKTFTFGVNFNF